MVLRKKQGKKTELKKRRRVKDKEKERVYTGLLFFFSLFFDCRTKQAKKEKKRM